MADLDGSAALRREDAASAQPQGTAVEKIDRLLVHTFATDNYVAWAELFLEALRFHHGQRPHVRLDGWDLSDDRIALLRKIYANLDVRNRSGGDEDVAEKLGVDLATVLGWKDEIEYGETTDRNFRFKLFISVDQRYRSLQSVAAEAKERGYDYLIHSDVDVYLRRPLHRLLEIIDRHDISVFLRETDLHRMKALGAFLGLNLKGNVDAFLERWMREIDAVPLGERWRGFGQSALWFAIEKSHDIRLADLTTIPDGPRYSKRFDKKADLWLTSNSKVIGPVKRTARKRCWDDLKRGLPRVEPDFGARNPFRRLWGARVSGPTG